MVYHLALKSRKKIPLVLGECLSIYTVMPRGKKRHINNNNFLSKSPPKRTDWKLKMGTCWGIFMTFICHMRELKANGLWVHAGKQIKYFPFFYGKGCMGIIWLFSMSKRMGGKHTHTLKGWNFFIHLYSQPGVHCCWRILLRKWLERFRKGLGIYMNRSSLWCYADEVKGITRDITLQPQAIS